LAANPCNQPNNGVHTLSTFAVPIVTPSRLKYIRFVIAGCCRPSAVVKMNCIIDRDVPWPEHKLGKEALNIKNTLSSNYSMSTMPATNRAT
jgi:hypothetical protein